MSDLISRADAINAFWEDSDIRTAEVRATLKALPSADAESDDLIIKGAKGIKDGLYNIKDGKLFMYKANGGTVRTYPIVPSADRPTLMNTHDVACILADVMGSTCACNFNDNDEWLPKYCDFADTCCPNPIGVACWEQYLKHRPKVEQYAFEQTDRPTEDYSDLPDIPRAYYEKIVGNMSHEINMLKEQLESADAVHGEWKFVDHEVFAGEYFCSICGKRAEVDLYGEWILSNYCGHCGARMKGGAE